MLELESALALSNRKGTETSVLEALSTCFTAIRYVKPVAAPKFVPSLSIEETRRPQSPSPKTQTMGLLPKVLESGMHLNNFLSWKVDPRVALLVEKTCFRSFFHLKECISHENKSLRQNLRFLIALVLKYDVESSCFSFTSEEEVFYLDIGLENILYITGFPIDGSKCQEKSIKAVLE
ncbi:hypothetical protein L484_023307 [Morus notabilis]|uniref:Uncharacterized protein n=1 Tax=Morus notabilis TaxID=981085 RepID=W9SCU8_9ROSA|nr:hypothetical protein L484_023307 [Morus notabilis]